MTKCEVHAALYPADKGTRVAGYLIDVLPAIFLGLFGLIPFLGPIIAGLLLTPYWLFRDVTVRHAAASDMPGELSLRIPVEGGRMQHEFASVVQDFESSQDVVEFTVKAMPIDDEGLKDVGFIKIDVEQHELPVLAGCMKTIEACRPAILTEVTPLLYPRPIPETFEFLTQLGYEGWFKFERKYVSLADFSGPVHANPEQWGGRFMDNNMIFLPKEFDIAFLSRSS